MFRETFISSFILFYLPFSSLHVAVFLIKFLIFYVFYFLFVSNSITIYICLSVSLSVICKALWTAIICERFSTNKILLDLILGYTVTPWTLCYSPVAKRTACKHIKLRWINKHRFSECKKVTVQTIHLEAVYRDFKIFMVHLFTF